MTDHNFDAKLKPEDTSQAKLQPQSEAATSPNLKAQAKLELEGGVYNFLPQDLIIVDAKLQKLTTFPRDAEVQVKWVPMEYNTRYHQPPLREEQPYDESWRADLVAVKEYHPAIEANPEPIGTLNGLFDLVAPLAPADTLLDFWRKAKALQHAHVEGLPDLKNLRKRNQHGPMPYAVVTRGVAMLAYLTYQEVDNVLLPALPVQLPSGETAYQALMPMRLVLAGLTSAQR